MCKLFKKKREDLTDQHDMETGRLTAIEIPTEYQHIDAIGVTSSLNIGATIGHARRSRKGSVRTKPRPPISIVPQRLGKALGRVRSTRSAPGMVTITHAHLGYITDGTVDQPPRCTNHRASTGDDNNNRFEWDIAEANGKP